MSDFNIGLAASPWIVALVIVAAFAVAIYTYSRTLPPVPSFRRWSLITLRTVGIGLLLLALFEPVLSMLKITTEEPKVIVAVDNSESMTLEGLDSTRIKEARRIIGSIDSSAIGGKTSYILFSDSARPLTPPLPYERIDASGTETDLNAIFTLSADSLRRQNIRAVVILSDGQYNAGSNPLFEAEKLSVPVYTVGFGDSTEPRDLSVQQVFTNEIAYVGTELPVEVRLKSAGYDGGAATVTLRDDNGVVSSQQISLTPGTNEYTANFVYRPRSEGIAKLQADISSTNGSELTTRNNTRATFVKVKSNKRRYVLIAGGPNPDVAFMKRLLEQDPNIELKTFVQKNRNEFLEGKLDASAFREAEAVVLIDYPTKESSDEAIGTIRSVVTSANLPLLVVTGSRIDFSRLRSLESILPVTFGQQRNNEMLAFPELTEDGKQSPIVRGTNTEEWKNLPPLFRGETVVRAKPESEVVAVVRLGGTRIDEPLIVTRKLGRSRSMIVLGYGIYRWELINEGTRQLRGEQKTNILSDFVGNSLRWLATHEEEKRVRIAPSKQLYNLGETVRILAQVYDDTYAPLSDAQVTVTLQGPERSYPMSLAPVGNGRYEGTLANLPSGDYRFTGEAATQNGQKIGSDAGRFTIGEIGLEFMQPSMNIELLRALAQRTGGKFFTSREAGMLPEAIARKDGFSPRSVESQNDFLLWNYPWVLAVALLAFALEWIIRKRSGML